jgi:hypothetical protein
MPMAMDMVLIARKSPTLTCLLLLELREVLSGTVAGLQYGIAKVYSNGIKCLKQISHHPTA